MTVEELTEMIASRMGDQAHETNDGALAAMCIEFRGTGIAYAVYTAASGILYADGSCRISGLLVMHIRKLSRQELYKLVARVALACPTIGDVPAWVNSTLFEEIA